MSRRIVASILVLVAAVLALSGAALGPAFAAADPAVQKATATCKAQVGEEARYHEMSWFARHKAMKKCIKETLAGH